MLSLNPDQKLSRIAGDLERSGACALLLIDIASLADIERRYGVAAHHEMVSKLLVLVGELAGEFTEDAEVLVTEDRGAGFEASGASSRPNRGPGSSS